MIAVIADDFTGAAEIGGVGLKYGLKVVVETRMNGAVDADLLVVAANTRSMGEVDAFNEIEKITKELLKYEPEFIYKKVDSVLRGNIATEIIAQLKITGKSRAVMVAGNPSFGRIIENGLYSVKGIPLAETSFAYDPEFPVESSTVTEIVKSGKIQITSLAVDEVMPENGIVIGDVCSEDEMRKWAKKIDSDNLVAGGAGFFDVILSEKYSVVLPDCNQGINIGGKALCVMGSKYPKSASLPMGVSKNDAVRLNMPDEIYENCNFDYKLLEIWAVQIVDELKKNKKVIVTVEQGHSREPGLSGRIRKNMGELVKRVADKIELTDLIVEGGATTSEVLRLMDINKLFPERLVTAGIIQMKTVEYPKLTITTKPGSYPWPGNVIKKSNNNVIGVDL